MLFLVPGVNFYEVIVLQSVRTAGLCVCICACSHDSIPGWTYSGSAQGSCRFVLPKLTSCLWTGPLPSLKHFLIRANKASRCTVIITQSSRWIVPFGFPPIFLIHSSWQYSLEATFPIRMFLCISFYCTHSCYWEEFFSPQCALHLRRCWSVNLLQDVRKSDPRGKYLGGRVFQLECVKRPSAPQDPSLSSQ